MSWALPFAIMNYCCCSRTYAALWLTGGRLGAGYLLLTLGTALSGSPHLLAIAAMRLLSTLFGLGYCFLIDLLLSHPRLSTTKLRRIALACVAPVAAESMPGSPFSPRPRSIPTLDLEEYNGVESVKTIAFWTVLSGLGGTLPRAYVRLRCSGRATPIGRA